MTNFENSYKKSFSYICVHYFHIDVTIMKYVNRFILSAVVWMTALQMFAADKVVALSFGNMDQWTIRKIHESAVIGGQTKTLYEIGPNRTLEGNNPYTNGGGSPWGTSNVMAKVMGVDADDVSIKATTTEKLGFTGREEGISAYATVLIEKD